MAKSRKRTSKKSRRSYGVARKNPYGILPLLSGAGLAAAAGTVWAGWHAYDSLTRPAVLVGTGAGVIAAYKYGKGLVDRAAYTVVGTGVGLVVDRYLFPEE